MKIAVLIQCHKNAKQINLLLNKLNHPDIDCYLHIDRKADFEEQIIHRKCFRSSKREACVSRVGKNFTGRCNDKSFVSFYFWGMTITG